MVEFFKLLSWRLAFGVLLAIALALWPKPSEARGKRPGGVVRKFPAGFKHKTAGRCMQHGSWIHGCK